MDKLTPEKELEVLKAAHKSLHDHFTSMKAALDSHHAAMSGLIQKVAKMAGSPAAFTGSEKEGGQDLADAKPGTTDTEVKKVAKTPEEIKAKEDRKEAKRVRKAAFAEAIIKLSTAVGKLSAGDVTKAAGTEVIGDKKDVVETGKKADVKKSADPTKNKEIVDLASAAFNQPGKPGDPEAMSKLYDQVVTRGPRMA